MEAQTEPIILKEDVTFGIQLLDGDFEANEELLSLMRAVK